MMVLNYFEDVPINGTIKRIEIFELCDNHFHTEHYLDAEEGAYVKKNWRKVYDSQDKAIYTR